jgi:transcriptional regulator with XRE-family HTH domain
MKQILSPDASDELKQLAQHISIARKRRRITLRSMAERTGVSIATLSRLERGDPTVSVGGVLQVLGILGLAKGLSRILAPENDIEQTLHEVREIRRTKRELPLFKEEELDF